MHQHKSTKISVHGDSFQLESYCRNTMGRQMQIEATNRRRRRFTMKLSLQLRFTRSNARLVASQYFITVCSVTFEARLQMDGRSRAPMAHPVVSLVSPLSKLSSLPPVCRLACRASNKLPRTSLSVGRPVGPARCKPGCSRATEHTYVAIMRRAVCARVHTAQDCVKCKQAAYAHPVSPIIGVITCKQLVYPVIMDLPTRRWLMNSVAQAATSIRPSLAFPTFFPFAFLLSSSSLTFFFLLIIFARRSRFLSRAIHLHPGDRPSCYCSARKFIGIVVCEVHCSATTFSEVQFQV